MASELFRTAEQDDSARVDRADTGPRLARSALEACVPAGEREQSWIGRELDNRYRILGLLGEGGMGAVFLAQHLALQKPVALKVVRAEFVGNGEALIRLAREAMATAQFEHRHVVSAIDCATLPEGGAYFVMQLVRGISLRSLLAAQQRIPWPRACELAAQIADALGAAEAAGVIHRDLKPDNILVEEHEDGSDLVKVLDFGIAHIVPREAAAPSTGQTDRVSTHVATVMGTPGYMAPEQAIGAKVDHRCDLYALGVILWECVAGRPLWDGPDVATMILRQMSQDAPRLSHVVSEPIPAELDRLVQQLVERMPTARPEHAAGVCDALRRIADQCVWSSPEGGDRGVDDDAEAGRAAGQESAIVRTHEFDPGHLVRLAVQPAVRWLRKLSPASPGAGRWLGLLALGMWIFILYWGAYEPRAGLHARRPADRFSRSAAADASQPLLRVTPVAQPAGPAAEAVIAVPLAAAAAAEGSILQSAPRPPRARRHPSATLRGLRGAANGRMATKVPAAMGVARNASIAPNPSIPPVARVVDSADSPDGKNAAPIEALEANLVAADRAERRSLLAVAPRLSGGVAERTERRFELKARVRDLKVRGSLATSVVRRAVQRISSQMFACYDSGSAAGHGSNAVDVEVEVEFDERGHPNTPRVRGAASAALNDCVGQAAANMALSGAPDTGVARAAWTVTFASAPVE